MKTPRRNRLRGRGQGFGILPRAAEGSALRRIGLSFAAVLGWFLALGSLQGWLDFQNLLESETDWFRDDLVFINREVRLSDSVGFTSSEVNPKTLEKLRAVEGVELAEPVERNHFPAAVEIGGGAIPTLASEIFVEAIPPSLFKPDIDDWSWKPGDPLVPVLVPRQFLNLYNFGFAPGKGLPAVSESVAQRVRFSLIAFPAGGGTPVSFTASIAGFSDQIESIMVPLPFLTWANERFGEGPSDEHGRVAVALRNPDSREFYQLLEENRLLASRGTQEMARLRILLDLSLGILGTAGVIILALVLLLTLAEAESLIADHRDRIRKLYLIGHPPSTLIRRMVGIRIIGTALPALAGLGLLWVSRQPIVAFVQEAGIPISADPSTVAVSVWLLLLAAINFALILRIRSRLIRLYE